MTCKRLSLGVLLLFVAQSLLAQITDKQYLNRVTLQTDSASFTSDRDTALLMGRSALRFTYYRENEVCDVKLFVGSAVKNVLLQESSDYALIDSVVNFNNQYYSFRVQFQHLSQSSFLRFRLQLQLDTLALLRDITLMPCCNTRAQLKTNGEELAVGEEKVFQLYSNLPENIRLIPEWQSGQDIDYRVTAQNGVLQLHVLANATGNKTLTLPLKTNKPEWKGGLASYSLPILTQLFTVKSMSLGYVQIDHSEIMLDEQTKTSGIEVQIDNSRFLEQNSVYLIEEHEAAASLPVAELITKQRLSNNRMLCTLRVFNYHRKTDGYLYIKEGTTARCITNFNVIPRVTIERIRVMRNGQDWVDDGVVYPGETITVRVEGQSLDKSHLHFDELMDIKGDSLARSETSVEYRLKVPVGISQKSINIRNFGHATGKYLTVKEWSKSRPFDYILLQFGNRNKHLTEINGPELYDKTIRDVVIAFVNDKIDSENKLYGKQALRIDVKVLGKKGEVIDFTSIDNLMVCPGEKSPRFQYYDKASCSGTEISLNSRINNATYNLKDWSRIQLTFRTPSAQYGSEAQTKTIEIVLQKHYKFDVDVSFPAGLLVKRANTSGFGNFGGVSMAVMGQFSFYERDKINRLRPYKVGAGFLALNAFNFSNDASSRDVGAVVIGSLSPMNTERKLSFSLYLGGGYLLSAKTMFWLIGPGVNVQF